MEIRKAIVSATAFKYLPALVVMLISIRDCPALVEEPTAEVADLNELEITALAGSGPLRRNRRIRA